MNVAPPAGSTDDESLRPLGSSARNRWSVSETRANLVRESMPPRPITVQTEGKLVTLDLARAAIVIIDMQNDFCHPEGWLGHLGVDVAPARTPIAPLQRLLPALRGHDVPVIWVNWGNRPDRLNLSPALLHVYKPSGTGVGLGDTLPGSGAKVLERGSWSAAIVDELAAERSDIHVAKYRMSGFQDTELDSILRNLGVTTLMFAGVNADQCVMCTLQDANFRGYDCLLVEDCAATTSPDYCLAATLYNVRQCFGFVVRSEAIVAELASHERDGVVNDLSSDALNPLIPDLIADLGDIPVVTDPKIVRRRSRDFFWYSPVLNEQLNGKSADLIVAPRDEADVVRVAAACARHKVPLTVRAGGTGNYGQAVPLQGGVLLDITALAATEWIRPGIMRVGVGAKMNAIDAELQPLGWELRMHPSTKRTATIGGFVAGGSGGIGSVNHGGLREPGNILAARIVTVEEQPRIIELRGDAAQKINRAYGTTGIITALEMPLTPAWKWIDVVVVFDDFIEAAAFGYEAALADGIVKKVLAPITSPIPSYFGALKPYCPDGKSILIAMIAEPSLESFKSLLGGRGTITLESATDDSPGQVPLYEYTWNHTTLQVLKSDRTVTYLQCLYPHDQLMEKVAEMRDLFPDEVLQHLEFIRFNGRVTCSGLPVVRYTTEDRLNEIIALHEANGVFIANPHVFTVEDGSRYKRADVDQLGFKHEVDPYGLLNPGKMRSFVSARR